MQISQKNSLLDKVLRCPICKNRLTRSNIPSYRCNLHGDFPIVEGIPLFSREPSEDFDLHWKKNAVASIPKTKLDIAKHFLKPLISSQNKEKILCLDAGCGDGVHAKVLKEEDLNINLVGLDISLEALKSCRKQGEDNIPLIKGDLNSLPFSDGVFDCVFSFGVVAYTVDPLKSFQEMCRVASVDGLVGLWIAPHQKGPLGFLLRATRRLCKFAGSYITDRIADLLVPLLGILPTASKISLRNATWRQCREIILVNIAPKNIYFPEIDEVNNWFHINNLEIIWKDNDPSMIIWGRKRVQT